VDVAGDPLLVTVSIGVTKLQPSDNLESVVQRVDRLMYKSKCAGRNR
jgi:PleD family two-component response regulator